MTHVFVIYFFHPVELSETSESFTLSNFVRKWLKFGFLGQYGQKTIFQTNGQKPGRAKNLSRLI